MEDKEFTEHKFFLNVSTSIAVAPGGVNPITHLMELQLVKSIVAVDTIGRVWEWNNTKWVELKEQVRAAGA